MAKRTATKKTTTRKRAKSRTSSTQVASRHEQNWANRMILGDSLLVMTSLAEKEGLKGKVQMIYLDPPYGIKFGSNWQVSTRKRDVKDGKAEDATRQPEQIRSFRDTWQLGIHSYLAYLRDRLVVARELLTEGGSIFVQIGDELESEYYDFVELSHGQIRRIKNDERLRGSSLPNESRLFASDQLTSQGTTQTRSTSIEFRKEIFSCPVGLHWKTTIKGVSRLAKADRVLVQGKRLRYRRFVHDFPLASISNTWLGTQLASREKIYVVQTARAIAERCLLITTDLVLDPTCGSGTTAYVAEQWNRRWITIDTSRVALALARTRRSALRRQKAHPRHRTVHRRKPVAASHVANRR